MAEPPPVHLPRLSYLDLATPTPVPITPNPNAPATSRPDRARRDQLSDPEQPCITDPDGPTRARVIRVPSTKPSPPRAPGPPEDPAPALARKPLYRAAPRPASPTMTAFPSLFPLDYTARPLPSPLPLPLPLSDPSDSDSDSELDTAPALSPADSAESSDDDDDCSPPHTPELAPAPLLLSVDPKRALALDVALSTIPSPPPSADSLTPSTDSAHPSSSPSSASFSIGDDADADAEDDDDDDEDAVYFSPPDPAALAYAQAYIAHAYLYPTPGPPASCAPLVLYDPAWHGAAPDLPRVSVTSFFDADPFDPNAQWASEEEAEAAWVAYAAGQEEEETEVCWDHLVVPERANSGRLGVADEGYYYPLRAREEADKARLACVVAATAEEVAAPFAIAEEVAPSVTAENGVPSVAEEVASSAAEEEDNEGAKTADAFGQHARTGADGAWWTYVPERVTGQRWLWKNF